MIPVSELYTLGGGLNIEGGSPYLDLKRTSKCKWVNLVVVLNRPLIDNHLFNDILVNSKYPLLENCIENLNEKHMLASYIMIIGYYLEYSHSIVGLSDEDTLYICIHVHQDVTCQPLINMLRNYVDTIMTTFGFNERGDVLKLHNVKIEYRTDNKWYSPQSYENINILISLSQCAGLEPTLNPGDFIIPTKFIPYDIEHKIVHKDRTYHVHNDLLKQLPKILQSKYHDYAIHLIKHYVSKNRNKQHTVDELSEFYKTTILQVHTLWNPKDPHEMVCIKYV